MNRASCRRATAAIPYTSRPAFTNASGQTCREYKSTQTVNGRVAEVLGTACQDSGGTWRVAN